MNNKIVLKYLNIPVTSMPAEQIHSTVDNIILQKKRIDHTHEVAGESVF